VAETSSFTLAAGRLFQSQSSLTATIKQLENTAGLKLFDRSTRRVELTKDAVWFKDVADRVLRDFDNAIIDLQAVSKSRRGSIKIAAAPSMMTHVLAPTLIEFRRSFPEIRISVYDAGSDKIEQSVLKGEMDFGISSRLNNFPDLDYTPIIADPFGAVFPKSHPLANVKGKLKWSDLKRYDYIGLTRDTGIGALLDDYPELGLKDRGDTYDHASSTTSLYALLKLGVHDYDVVVLDRDLPGVHGDTVCRMITEREKAGILGGNAARLFRLPRSEFAAVTPPSEASPQ